LTHTLPLDLAATISGLEAVPLVAPVEADFLAVLLAVLLVEELAPGVVAAAAELAAGVEVVAGAGAVVEAAEDFRLPFFAVVSDEPEVFVEAEVWSAASVPEDFFLWLDFDLLELEEVLVPPTSELAAVSDFVLFLDFLLDDFVSLAAVA
jgi:hypothetical protein